MLAIYRDDQIGPIGQGFVPRHSQTKESFESDYALWFAKGFYIVCLQGYGVGDARRFAAIFVNNETPVQRTVRITGTPVVTAIDNAVTDLMKRSNIRGAALAIVKGTTLVLARGYTWAEPDYPAVQPTTSFRLASCSKLITALGIHQLAAEGVIDLEAPLASVLPLTTVSGGTPTNSAYVNGTVSTILEYPRRFERYERVNPQIAEAFQTQLPVTRAQIASYVVTRPPLGTPEHDHLDDTGYFLAGEVIKRARQIPSLMDAIAPRLTKPLNVTRLHTARAQLALQPAGEARHHPRDMRLQTSVMTSDGRLVPLEYGDENLETMEPSGGLSAAAPDLVRVLAAMNLRPYSPLGRPAVDRLLQHASINGRNGHGFDELRLTNSVTPRYEGDKGGLLETSQSGIWFGDDDFSYVILWNGLHTESDLSLDGGDGPGWYPTFTKVLDAARANTWSTADLFPTFGMPILPTTQDNFRRCQKCRGMFFGGSSLTKCPAGGSHSAIGSGSYRLMRNSSFAYGQQGWRVCTKCQSVFFSRNRLGVCPAGGAHDATGGSDYTIVHSSPYYEPQHSWRWCRKCEALFFAEMGRGVCPAGGVHDPTGSGNYSVTGAGVEANEIHHIVYRGADAQVQELYIDSTGNWRFNTVSLSAGAPKAAGDPHGYQATGVHHIVYRGTDNHVHELVINASGNWVFNTISAAAAAPAAAGNPFGYQATGVHHVVYRSADSHIQELFINFAGAWACHTITKTAGAPLAAGDPQGYQALGVHHVVYRGLDGQVHELYIDATGHWRFNTVTISAGAPKAAGDPFGYETNGVHHIVYRGVDGQVHELFINSSGNWVFNTVSAAAGAPAAAGDPQGYHANGVHHIVYRSAQNQIVELFIDSTGNWRFNIVSGNAHAPLAAGDPFGYEANGVHHIVYRGVDGQLYELFIDGGGNWAFNTVTISAGAQKATGTANGYVTGPRLEHGQASPKAIAAAFGLEEVPV
jgi:CubicO group peptidase (beta-lactamase class C family)